jgi:hypothetical protein
VSDGTERWLPVPGYETAYEVSDHGRVRSLDRRVPSGQGKTRIARGRILRPSLVHGHPAVSLGRVRKEYVHALVLQAFVGPAPDGMECCHGDGVRTNNHLSNLRWGTRLSNNLDAIRHGTHYNTSRVRCPRDHSLESPNLDPAHLRAGKRQCWACSLTLAWGWPRGLSPADEEWLVEAHRRYAEIAKFGAPIKYNRWTWNKRWWPELS